MASVFNPEQFLQTQVSGTFSTERVPVPEGEYTGLIDSVTGRILKLENGDERPIMEVTWEIPDESVATVTGRKKNTVRQDIWLDINGAGALDMEKGQNVSLGQLLTAVGLNGKRWSPSGLKGLQGKVLVTHRTTDSGVFAQVRKVLKP